MINKCNNWHIRFLRQAREISTWSKDPSTKVGAVLVSPNRRAIVPGYNGFPSLVEDRPEDLMDRGTRIALTIHAEMNAILTAARSAHDIAGWTCYVYPVPPCVHCLAALVQQRVDTVVTIDEDDPDFNLRWGIDSPAYQNLLQHIEMKFIGKSVLESGIL